MWCGCHLNSDHCASLRLERMELWSAVSHNEFSQRGWAPKTDEAKQIFVRGFAKDLVWMNDEAKGKALVSVEEIIYSHAVGIDSDNSSITQWSGLQEDRKRLAELGATLSSRRVMTSPSSDRHAWAAAAGEHGREVYRDDNNNVDVQMQRVVRLQHLAQREIEAGWQPPAVKFHDFLNALALSWSTLFLAVSPVPGAFGRLGD